MKSISKMTKAFCRPSWTLFRCAGRSVVASLLSLFITAPAAHALDFSIRESIPLPPGTSIVAVRDMDNDEVLDLVLTDGAKVEIVIMEREGAGFVKRASIPGPVGYEFRGGALVDEVDGDQTPDILGTYRIPSTRTMRADVFEADENDVYVSRQSLPDVNVIEGMTSGDSDDDGRREWITAQEANPGDSQVHIFEATSDNVYTQRPSLIGPGGDAFLALHPRDLDGDGKTEVVFTAGNSAGNLYVFDGRLQVFTESNAHIQSFALGDLDGDGFGEIIAVDADPGGGSQLIILESNGINGNDTFTEVFNGLRNHYTAPLDINPADAQTELWRVLDSSSGLCESGDVCNVFSLAHRSPDSGTTITDFFNSGPLLQCSTDPIRNVLAIGDTNGDSALELAVQQGSVLHILEEGQQGQVGCPGENQPPEALCKNVTVSADANCQGSADVNNGSSDPDDDPITLDQDPTSPYDLGDTLVTLTVTDDQGASDSCQATVTVVDDTLPDVTCPSDQTAECTGSDGASVPFDATATDNCAQVTTISCAPPSESTFSLGNTTVTCTATDDADPPNKSTCDFTVTVEDTAPPEIQCNNAPGTIVPPDAPISFTATATDACGSVSTTAITGFDCFFFNPAGKRVDKTGSCVVQVSGDTITIVDSGGVGDHITWTVTAADSGGNTTTDTCEVEVVNPGKGKGKK